MIRYLFAFTIFISILSQLPAVIEMGVSKYMAAIWVLPFSILAFKQSFRLTKTNQSFIFFAVFFFFYCFTLETFTGTQYVGSDIRNVFISLLIYITSYMFWYKQKDEANIQDSIHANNIALLLAGFILTAYIYTEYLLGVDVMARTYAYQEKNSAGQIILCCSLIPLITNNFKKSSRLFKTFFILTLLFSLYVIFLLKARSTLLGLFFIVLYFIIKSNNRRLKRLTFYTTVLSLIILFTNSKIQDKVVIGIFLSNRDVTDLNDISSGRLELIDKAIRLFDNNIFFGAGDYYVDCLPINLLVEYGIVGASIVFIFIYYLTRNIFNLNRNIPIHLTTYLLWCIFLINSLLEAYAPFGPGMKCFFVWMFLGLSMALIDKHKSGVVRL